MDHASGDPASSSCPVVGIGASAGGIEAIIALFGAMPNNSGAAYLIVMHLDPKRESHLAEVLDQKIGMTVVQAADGMAILPDHVYVIAPDAALTVRDGTLSQVVPVEQRGHRYPINALFRSLAAQRLRQAICIVLSGSGNDGTEGLKDVKAAGGFIVVQDPKTAGFDGMPRSAIEAALADRVLAPEQIPDVLIRYMRHEYYTSDDGALDPATDGPALDQVLTLLRLHASHDFSHYKGGTIMRRVHHRMGLSNLHRVGDYAERLRVDKAEADSLIKDLMISVTGFFRDGESWEELGGTIVKPLVASRTNGASIRAWAAACATGEEAFSLAMLLLEHAEQAGKHFDIKVFGTDARDDNIGRARMGIYPDSAVASISPERLSRFFNRQDNHYQVNRELRSCVVFAKHNLLHDPPFSQLDLISCRNLLIYLDVKAQQQALSTLQFALREGGYLFLGNTETVGQEDGLFESVSKAHRIYRRIGPTSREFANLPPRVGSGPRNSASPNSSADSAPPYLRVAEVARRVLIDRFAPASVLIDGHGRAIWFHGATGDYLEQPPGEPSRDLLALARPGLRTGIRHALRRATAEGRTVEFDARITQGGRCDAVAVTLAPVDVDQQQRHWLVTFEPGKVPLAVDVTSDAESEGGDGKLDAIESELNVTRAELQSVVAEFERSNQDLKFASEDVISINEELQATNEELETSKEELQSFNEELQTVNTQLEHKIHELEETKDTLNNLLISSEIATVFLDRDLCIRWFSPASKDLLALVTSDVGRPISHFAWKFLDPSLLQDAQAVMEEQTGAEAEVRSDSGSWYARRLTPFRTRDDRIAGVVVTFTDVTERKRLMDVVNDARRYAEATVNTVRHPILVLDGELQVQSVNPVFCEAFACPVEDTEGSRLEELDHGAWDIPELRQLLRAVLMEGTDFEAYSVQHEFPKIGRRHMLLNARKLVLDGRPDLILLAVEDVTPRVTAEARSDLLIHELNHRVKNMLAMVQAIGAQTAQRSSSIAQFSVAFDGRLRALAGVHELIVNEDWHGVELGTLARRALGPFDSAGRITIDGPDVRLNPDAGMALAMVLHELATNAVKYGALSSLNGRVMMMWRLQAGKDSAEVRLQWIETGGPAVAPPGSRGFGISMIERSVEFQLAGRATLSFPPEGLRYELTFPVASAPPTSKLG